MNRGFVSWTTSTLLATIFLLLSDDISAFVPARHYVSQSVPSSAWIADHHTTLEATGGKRKRRRKKPVTATSPDPIKVSQETIEGVGDNNKVDDPPPIEDAAEFELKPVVAPPPRVEKMEAVDERVTEDDLLQMKDVAKFEFKSDDISRGIQDKEQTEGPVGSEDSSAIPLPDIKEALRKKEMEKELARMVEEEEMKKPKIKRSDKDAFTKLLEQQPFADADDSFFEEEEYSTVSALLGERAEKFLGIPSGPLQVGHFIGALGIILMAFVEYPGFPLTNLPTPLRDALQGGLAIVYSINAVLAVLAAFKAKERGQPIPLWVGKTLTVGGLALDQLTQLPTLEAIEKAKSVKGARAIKKKWR